MFIQELLLLLLLLARHLQSNDDDDENNEDEKVKWVKATLRKPRDRATEHHLPYGPWDHTVLPATRHK